MLLSDTTKYHVSLSNYLKLKTLGSRHARSRCVAVPRRPLPLEVGEDEIDRLLKAGMISFEMKSCTICKEYGHKFDKCTGINQCYNCLKFGHSSFYCLSSPRCVTCGGHHHVSACRKETLSCANCGDNHPGSYRGCPVYHSAVAVIRRGIGQCYQCQQFGHPARLCRNDPRCAKCARRHHTLRCRRSSVCCVNCGGRHKSVYGGCPKYMEAIYADLGKNDLVRIGVSNDHSYCKNWTDISIQMLNTKRKL